MSCPICWTEFPDQNAVNQHVREMFSNKNQEHPISKPPILKGRMTAEQSEKLFPRKIRSKTKGKPTMTTENEYWYEMWKVLFPDPDEPRPKSPCIDPKFLVKQS